MINQQELDDEINQFIEQFNQDITIQKTHLNSKTNNIKNENNQQNNIKEIQKQEDKLLIEKNFIKENSHHLINPLNSKKKQRFLLNKNTSIKDFFMQCKKKIKNEKKIEEKIIIPEKVIIQPILNHTDNPIPIFDNQGKWTYLNRLSYRKYQFQITQQALIQNTLVCLPTGLGKTFISTNVIYNYYKWFPDGLIIFLAPTKPLVNQQISSIQKVKGINNFDVKEVTGNILSKNRKIIYTQRRILFMTPQTLQNDLEKQLLNPQQIVLIVYDEAHRASGNYAYSIINKILKQQNIQYRVLALSATPGNDIKKIQNIIDNLSISHIEIREEKDPDVQQYLKDKQIETILIQGNDEITSIEYYIQNFITFILEQLKPLIPKEKDLIPQHPNQVNFITIKRIQDSFKNNQQFYKNFLQSQKISTCWEYFKILYRISSSKKQLNTQGIQVFKNSYQNLLKYINQMNSFNKQKIQQNESFKEIQKKLEEISYKNSENHPKMVKLMEILNDFFQDEEQISKQSKVIIFTHNRNNAYIIEKNLNENLGIRATIFIGQNNGKKQNDDSFQEDNEKLNLPGMKQQQQLEVLQNFKNGKYNVLVATCVAEEGLDIGEVNLIICYDSGLSPIRMIQRMGRTGRKNDGRIILLLTEKF